MKEMIGHVLQPMGDIILGILTAIPLPLVRIAFLLLLAALAFGVLRLAPQQLEENKDRNGIFTDLRTMAVLLLCLQSVFYIVF